MNNYNNTKLNGLLDDIIKLVPVAVQTVPAIFGGGASSSGGQAKGLREITAFVNQVLSALDSLPAEGLPLDQMLAKAETLASALSNPQYVYQAKKGDDARVLREGKASARRKVDQIRQALAGTTSTNTTTAINPVTGQPQVAQQPLSIAGGLNLDTSDMVMIGGSILALFLIIRKR